MIKQLLLIVVLLSVSLVTYAGLSADLKNTPEYKQAAAEYKKDMRAMWGQKGTAAKIEKQAKIRRYAEQQEYRKLEGQTEELNNSAPAEEEIHDHYHDRQVPSNNRKSSSKHGAKQHDDGYHIQYR